MPARHPQIARHEQRMQLRRVLGQPTIAHLRKSGLPLDYPERVLHLRPQARLHVLDLELRTRQTASHLRKLARAHRNKPLHIATLVLFALVHALVARVTEHQRFFAVQQARHLRHVGRVGRRAHHRVHQARMQVHPNMRLHAKEIVVALLRFAMGNS